MVLRRSQCEPLECPQPLLPAAGREGPANASDYKFPFGEKQAPSEVSVRVAAGVFDPGAIDRVHEAVEHARGDALDRQRAGLPLGLIDGQPVQIQTSPRPAARSVTMASTGLLKGG